MTETMRKNEDEMFERGSITRRAYTARKARVDNVISLQRSVMR